MSQPQMQPFGMVSVPSVIGETVKNAGPKISNPGLVPAWQGTDGNPIEDPNDAWYVQTNGESPSAGSSVDSGSTVTLTIAALKPPMMR